MDDLSRRRLDPSSAIVARSRSLRRLRLLDPGRWHAPLGRRQGARFFGVCGQRGVGKSTVTANLAIALAGLRSRVVLIDLDLRHPTQHGIFGLAAPVSGLRALMEDEVDTMEQVLTPTRVRNLFLVAANGMRPPAHPPGPEQQRRLLQQIWELDADVVIADIVTDQHAGLVDLFALGALRIVVAAPDTPSIRSAYNFFRAEVLREIEHVAGGTSEAARLVAAAMAGPQPRLMQEMLAVLHAQPNVQAAVTTALGAFGGRLVGNRAHNSSEADLLHAASRLFADYLGVSVPVLGIIEASEHLGTGAHPGRPLLLGAGIDRNVRLFHSMAEQLLVEVGESEAPRCVTGEAANASAPPLPLEDRVPRDDGGEGAPLPISLGVYMRRFPRHPVDWHARYISAAGRHIDVRVFEVSEGGASIEAIAGFDLGDQGRLTFTQIEGQPTIAVTVMDARRPMGRAGLRFEGDSTIAIRLTEIARRTSAAAAPPKKVDSDSNPSVR